VNQLFTHSGADIAASPEIVWRVLTDASYTKQWVGHFQPVFSRLESRWSVGDSVHWISSKDELLVDGIVKQSTSPRRLAYTVRDVVSPSRFEPTADDGITCLLEARGTGTWLVIRQGDFGKIAGGQDYYEATVQSWARALPVIQSLAETSCEGS
jgi:uncharacterized protein YndB with AHSA1/START domain